MGLFGGGKKKKEAADLAALEEAVYRDCSRAFEAMEEEKDGEQICSLALCIDNDAMSFYIMGNTVEGWLQVENREREQPFTADDLTPDSYFGSPADWAYSYPTEHVKSNEVLDRIWNRAGDEFEETQEKVLKAIVRGMKRFNDSGAFTGKLPRDRMVLTLWQNDPDNPDWVLGWAKELNPPEAFEWFQAGYPYEADTEL